MNQQTRELHSLLDRIRRRWFRLVALRTAGRATAATAIPIFAALAVDRVLAPAGIPLLLLAGATLFMALGLASVVLWRMQRRPDDRHVARFVEEIATAVPECGPMDDALVSAVEVAEAPADPARAAFVPLIVATGVQRLRALDPACLISSRSLRRAAAEAITGAALLGAAMSIGAGALARAFETAMVCLFPESIRVEVVPGDSRAPAGTPLRVRATVYGRAGALTQIAPSLTVWSGGSDRTVAMTRAGDASEYAYEYAFESIDRTFAYHVSAGTARSSTYTVTALFPPRVNRIDLHYAYPVFAGLPPRDEQDGGDIYAPAGTRVRLRIRTDKPIARGALAIGGASSVALRRAGDRTYEADLVLARDGSYRVTLADADGLRSDGDTEYFIRLMDDRPPDVRILRPSSDQQITPLEEVEIEARADDDYGIARFDLVYSVAGGEETIVPFDRVSGTGVQKTGSHLLPAEELGVKPGDVIAYYARARDVGRGKRSTETRSDLFFLEVKPFHEEFVSAQSQAGQGMSGAEGAQIEGLIAAQKEIISATWNIERRSPAGRSEGDVKAIAQAQAALKARAETLSSRSGRRGRPPAPERLAPQRASRPSGTPIAAAIAAMTKAIAQLETNRTKEAIAHEMAALNGLLEVQAEVRRRQISQQASGAGSGGSNRAGQDLSALFDKELQRQQKTNYENRSQIEEREQPGDAALDRIRDLARRQEDLGRRQQELAKGGMTPEEMKRQLEKLTREQMQLRQEAEDLARQASRNGPQQSSQGQRGRAGEGGGPAGNPPDGGPEKVSGLREAGEQMRSAASELRRDDPGSAAQAAQRAAERLRNLEQQMRGGAAEGKRRASGNLQMEAQQIAQEQRRIASEAERLEQGEDGASRAARKLLADEKERLAGRVEELRRTAQQIGQGGGRAEADAARELQREKVGQRMRESATRLREQGPGAGGAGQAEQQIARALERVVGTLGGAASAQTKQLTDQLARTREIRDRLHRIEQQMREAAKNGGQAGPQAKNGRQGSRGASAGGQGGSHLQQLQQEYQRALARARDALGKLGEAQPRSGSGMATPEQEEFSRSAPGTEAFKQDTSGWASLRQGIDIALEKAEAAASDRLARKRTDDRFSGGGSDRVPERYTRLIAKYYESIAKVKK